MATSRRDKKLIRARMRATGELYTVALTHVCREQEQRRMSQTTKIDLPFPEDLLQAVLEEVGAHDFPTQITSQRLAELVGERTAELRSRPPSMAYVQQVTALLTELAHIELSPFGDRARKATRYGPGWRLHWTDQDPRYHSLAFEHRPSPDGSGQWTADGWERPHYLRILDLVVEVDRVVLADADVELTLWIHGGLDMIMPGLPSSLYFGEVARVDNALARDNYRALDLRSMLRDRPILVHPNAAYLRAVTSDGAEAPVRGARLICGKPDLTA